MAKKTWIKVKRGILEPKHRRKLGAAWFLYFYMLDLTNWEDGVIYDWKDKDVAADLEMPINTLRDHRRKLEDEQYIQTRIKKYGLEITINNWTNPREYSGQVYNQVESNEITEPSESSKIEGRTESDTESTEKLTPLHLIHSNTEHIKDSTPSRKEKTMQAIQEGYAEQEKHPNMFYPPDIIDTVTAFESAFKIKPPRRKETNFGLWIQKCKEINSLCAAYKRKPAEVIKQYFLAWDKDGRYYAVNGPESILKSLRGFLAEKESGTQYRGANGEVETF